MISFIKAIRQLTLVHWVALTLCLLVSAAVLNPINRADMLAAGVHKANDLLAYRAAVLLAQAGDSPYDMAGMERYQTPPFVSYYIYPPPALLFFIPFAQGGDELATELAHDVNVVLLALLITGVGAFIACLSGSLLCAAIAVLLLLKSQAVLSALLCGQVTGLIGLGTLMFLWGLRGQHNGLLAVGAVLAGVFKVTPGVIALLLLLRRYRVALVWLVALTLALCGLTWLIFPHDIWGQWLLTVAQKGYGQQVVAQPRWPLGEPYNMGLNAAVSRLLSPTPHYWPVPPILAPDLVKPLTYAASLLIFALALWISYVARAVPLVGAALLLWCSFILSPLCWIYNFLFAVPAAAYFMALWWRRRQWLPLVFMLGGFVAIDEFGFMLARSPVWACLPFAVYLVVGALFMRSGYVCGREAADTATAASA